tara:strand:- start:1777 stop:1911 length:135 start_codon:yes stop_codon:yes gene_type:complete
MVIMDLLEEDLNYVIQIMLAHVSIRISLAVSVLRLGVIMLKLTP